MFSGVASAQTNPPVPTVIVQATQPFATQASPGIFTIHRSGDASSSLDIWYNLSGSASNGVDYAPIPQHIVTLASGAVSNNIIIVPFTNSIMVNRTLMLSLTNSPLANPVNYQIGTPSSATVYLEDTNLPPAVSLTSPKNGAVFYAPTNIPLTANLSYMGYPFPTNILFFAGTNDLGPGTFGISSGFSASIFLTWTNPPPGSYVLTVVAYSKSLSITSAPVNITVRSRTNAPTLVTIISPTNGATFTAPSSIALLATVTNAAATISNVEFYAGTNDLGPGVPLAVDPIHGGYGGLAYVLNWPNPPAGRYSLTAVATGAAGASWVSAPITINVIEAPTNVPPVVRITTPANGAVYRAPVNIPIYAYASDIKDIVQSLQFFANSNSLGFGQPVTSVPPPLPPGPVQPPILVYQPTNYWELIWTNPIPGTNVVLTALATTLHGLATTSAPVSISILPPLPPPTNRPAIVSIMATDPIAIEGTNCWPWIGLPTPVATWSNWASASAIFKLETNCGPKNATFAVIRAGATNNDLNVTYSVGGSASNGVDYVTLPGQAMIPAGSRSTAIVVVPLDDGPPDFNSTVVLKLTPETNYIIGKPAAAAAIILDSRSPHLPTGVVAGNMFHLNNTGPNGAWYHVDYSTDMVDWSVLCTNQVVNGEIDFVDPDSAGVPARFYRAVPLQTGP